MHAVAAFFASIITFVSGFFAPTVASNPPVDVRTQTAAAATMQTTEIAGNPFTDPAAASAVEATIPAAAAPAAAVLPPPTQNVINQPVIERIIERVAPQGAANISTEKLAAILADFEQSISSRIAALNPPKATIPEQVAAAGSATGAFFSASQRIDTLTNTTITTPTISNPSISGGTFTNATVSGTLSGTFSGTSSFTGASTTALAITSIPWGLLSTDGSGNVVATSSPTIASITATSTTATSTFAGGFTAANGSFSILQNGNIGAGTAAPSFQLHLNKSTGGELQFTRTTAGNTLHTLGFLQFGNTNVDDSLASIVATQDGATDAGRLFFQTQATGGSLATTMMITSTGNVGIGTTTPSHLLDIQSTGAGVNAFAVHSAGGGDRFAIRTETAAANGGSLLWVSNNNGSGYGGPLKLDAANLQLYSGGTEVMRITGGNVGIGTTTPQQKLSIAGYLNVDQGHTDAGGEGGGVYHGISFGSNQGESIGSNHSGAGANQAGLDFYTAWTKRLSITNAGNVGIGTTSPAAALHVDGPGGDYRIRVSAGSNAVQTEMFADTAYLGGVGSVGTRNNYPFLIRTNDLERIYVGTNGHVGINTSGGSNVQLYVVGDSSTDFAVYGSAGKTTGAGVIGFSQNGLYYGQLGLSNNWGIYCAGVQCGGNVAWTNTSDARLKTAIQDIDASSTLAALMRLRPITYHWKDAAIDAGRGEQLGFIAQEVAPLFPDLVTKGASTTITLADGSKETIPDPKALDYSGFVVPLVKAVQEIASIGSTFKANLIAWLGSASNGIGDLFARDIYATNGDFQHLASDDLCLKRPGSTPICITADQLAALLGQAAATGALTTLPSAGSQSPVIELNGNATSTIDLGDSYNNLGARIIAPESDLNLGIVTLLDGATTTQVSIDTTQPGTHTILYTVTSPTTGLTGTTMRTIIIAPAEQSPEQPANDGPFNPAPANDNVSTSTLLNTEPSAVSL